MLRLLEFVNSAHLFFLCLILCASAYPFPCDLPANNSQAAYADAVQYLTKNGTHIVNVCIFQATPIAMCNPIEGTITMGNATGFMPDLFTQVAEYIGLYTNQYNFSCWYNQTALYDDVVFARGVCDISVADIDMRPQFILNGVRFPLALYSQGLQIVSPTYLQQNSLWEFFFPFSWELWLAWSLTIVFAAFSLYIMERLAVGETEDIGQPGLSGMLGAHWLVYGQAVNVVNIEGTKSLGARIFGLAFGLLMLVLVSIFTANMAAFVTTRQKVLLVNDIHQVAGMVVATYENYTGILEPYKPAEVIYLPWNTREDELNMIYGLLNGTYDALIIDSPFASYAASQYCGFATAGEPYYKRFLSMAFPSTTPMWVSLVFENALSTLQQRYQTIDQLTTQWLDQPDTCDGTKIVSSVQVQIESIAGLWIILGCGMFLGIMTTLYSVCKRRNLGPDHLLPWRFPPTKTANSQNGDSENPVVTLRMEAGENTETAETYESPEPPHLDLVVAMMKLTCELAPAEEREEVACMTREVLNKFKKSEKK